MYSETHVLYTPSFPCPALVSLWHSRRGETWLLRPQLGRAQPSLVQLGWVFCYVTVLTAATALIPHMHSRRKVASQLLCTCSFYCWVDNLHSSMILICSWESDCLWFFPWWEWVKGCLNMSWKMAGQWLGRWMVMSWYQRKFILNTSTLCTEHVPFCHKRTLQKTAVTNIVHGSFSIK